MPKCKRCHRQHHNFQKCDIARELDTMKQHVVGINRLKPTPGYRPWHGDKFDGGVEKLGDMIVKKSGLGPVRTGKLTYPKEPENA